MASHAVIARPYAEAVFQQARDSGSLAKWSEMLALAAALAVDPQIEPLARNPKVGEDEFTQLLLGICGDGLTEEGRNLLRLLVVNDRLVALPAIAELFEDLRAEVENTLEAEVVSAFEMDNKQIKRLAALLEDKLGRTVELTASVNPDLIGGVIIRAGDTVIDASLRGRLKGLSSQLNL
jgi:F-type H+-transporting ATPase subunit delta